MTHVKLGISTCPNDTFAFHGLMTQSVDWRGLEFDVELIDIQQLNDRLFNDEFDVAKTSFHAALWLADRTLVLPSGSALGFGVGPLLLSSRVGEKPETADQVTLCPGQHTTAALLFALFHLVEGSYRMRRLAECSAFCASCLGDKNETRA